MNFEINSRSLERILSVKTDALLVLWHPDTPMGDDAVSRLVARARKQGDFELKAGSLISSYAPEGVSARHLTVVCCPSGPLSARKSAVQAGWASFKNSPIRHLTVHWTLTPDATDLEPVVQGLAEGSYAYTLQLSQPKPRQLTRVSLTAPELAPAHQAALKRAQALVSGIEMAKEWANRPANLSTPTQLADAARALAKLPGIRCKVLGPKEVEKLGMGAFMAVAQGSDEPLRFIELSYQGAAKTQDPVVLVGKGITFDTGGISLKPAPEMDEMKYDMSGAASVLGVFGALAQLQPAVNVVGLIPATENMPSGRAVKPGDVVRSMSGQSIEILNTDAEGRLVLCDALTYAERFKPAAVIDIATLTGACVIALGAVRSGLFTPDDRLAAQLHQAGEASGDLCWRMPLDDEYAEGLKSRYADVANVGGRPAGSVTAAKFLQRFASRFAWAHLDIAGTAWKGGAAKGATGRPVGLLLHYLLQHEQPKSSRKKA